MAEGGLGRVLELQEAVRLPDGVTDREVTSKIPKQVVLSGDAVKPRKLRTVEYA